MKNSIVRILTGLACACLVAQILVAQSFDTIRGRVYEVDQQHALMDFTTRHLGFGRVRGTFNDYRASFFLADDGLIASSATAVIDVASLDTGNPGRDDHLKQVFFDVDEYPHIEFQSTAIVLREERYFIEGQLTIKGVTKEVELPLTVVTLDGVDHWEHRRLVLETGLTINRKDFNVVYDNAFWDGVVADEINIDISFAAFHYNARNTIFPWRKNSIGTFLKQQTEEKGVNYAVAEVRAMRSAPPEDFQFDLAHFYRAGMALAQGGDVEAGIKVLELGIEWHKQEAQQSDVADLYAAIAEAAAGEGRIEQAREALEQALSLDPLHPSARELRRNF